MGNYETLSTKIDNKKKETCETNIPQNLGTNISE